MGSDDPASCPLGDWVHRRAEKHGDRPALTFEGETWTYSAFAERIDRLALGIDRELGLEPGDRVAYLGHNHPNLLALVFAAARLSLIVVPMNWRLAPPEHQAIISDAAPAAVFVEEAFADRVGKVVESTKPPRSITLDFVRQGWSRIDDLLSSSGASPADDTSPADGASPLLIVYTSGTTGLAKGAVLTQDAVRWNAANSVDMHRMASEDRILTVLPLFHVGGLNIQTLPAFAVGAEVLLEARFDPGAVLEMIAKERATQTVLVPAMMKALIDHPGFEEADLSSLRQITTGSSQVPVVLIQAFHDRGIPATQVYGTTETAPIAVYQRAREAFRTIGSAGRIAKHGEMRLVGDDGDVTEPGIPGEIQIRGPQVMTGYWKNPSATEAAFCEGWFRTGDIGRIDGHGDLSVDARTDDLIKSGSERIYPAEIEDLLRAVDGVDEVIVVGRADPVWGEVPVAVVQQAVGCELDADRLLEHLDGRIARFKWPKEVHLVDTLPRSALGKVLRYQLRAELDRSSRNATS